MSKRKPLTAEQERVLLGLHRGIVNCESATISELQFLGLVTGLGDESAAWEPTDHGRWLAEALVQRNDARRDIAEMKQIARGIVAL